VQRRDNDGTAGQGKGSGMKLQFSRLGDSISRLRKMGEAIGSTGDLKRKVADSVSAVRRKVSGEVPKSNGHDPTLRISRYNLVLMDGDGQVVWGKEFDAGGAFEFRPGHRLYISCEFTNHSVREAEVAEFEIELAAEDGAVISRFGESFGDIVLVPPGESRSFVGQWSL
jgi:hypothetical protein